MSGEGAQFFLRLRLPILLVFAALAVWGAIAVSEPQPVTLAAAALGGFLAAYARLRHVWLALAAALAPLPGILWFGQAAYALSIAFAILMTADYSDALLKEQNPHIALARALPPLAGALLFACLWSLHVPVQLPGLLAAAAVTALCLPVLAFSVIFGEAAIVRGNRQREKLLRIFAFAGNIAEPRWSISLSGAGLVLAVLGWFEITAMPPAFDWLAAPVAGLLIFAFTLDIYAGFAGLAAAALILLFTGGVGGALLLFLLFALFLARTARRFRAHGEAAQMAMRRAMEEEGSSILFAGLAAMIAAVPRGGAVAALHAGCGLIAALILFPAFAGALRSIFPARRSIEEIYRASAS
jgi:hypothetical protein